jgi:CxxC-x17-CxxC domain-containing protein
MVSQDRTLTCAECGASFAFSAEDQRYHQEKGYTDPKRCPTCRANRTGRRSGSFGSSGGQGFGGPREMHDAVCGDCGQKTQVPFLPRGDRPVYCNNCFSKRRTSSGGSRGGYR